MKRIFALIIAVMLCLTTVPGSFLNVSAADTTVNYEPNFPLGVNFTANGESYEQFTMCEDGSLTWYSQKTGGYVIATNCSKSIYSGTNQLTVQEDYNGGGAIGAKPNLNAGTVVTGINGGSVDIYNNQEVSSLIKEGNTTVSGNDEMRYLVSADRKMYFAFGIDCTDQKPYYTKDGGTTKIKPDSWTFADDESTDILQKISVSFTIAGTTVDFEIVGNGSTTSNVKWNGNFEISNIDELTESCKYIQEFYAWGSGFGAGKQFAAIAPKVTYTTGKGATIVNYEQGFKSLTTPTTPGGASQRLQIHLTGLNSVDFATDSTIKWTARRISGDPYARMTYDTYWNNNSLGVYCYGGEAVIDGAAILPENMELAGIARGSVNLQSNSTEMRYLVSSNHDSYFAFGIDSEDSKPYYSVDGAKTKPSEWSEAAASADVVFSVMGDTVYFTVSGKTDTWKDSFVLDSIDNRIVNCAYVQSIWSKGTGECYKAVSSPSVSYKYTEAAEADLGEPNFVETFDEYTAANAKIGADNAADYNEKDLVVAENDNARWELSRFIYGEDTSGNNVHQSKAYLNTDNDSDGKYELTLMGSSAFSGVNLYPKSEISRLKKMEFDMTVSKNKYTAIRFLVNNDEKTAYEIGLNKDKFYIVKRDNLWAENNYGYSNGLVAGSEVVSGYGLDWGEPEDPNNYYNTQPNHYFHVAITPNETGFRYKVTSKESNDVVWNGAYTDPTGEAIVPEAGNPALQLICANANTSTKHCIDDVKLWYTPVIEPSAEVNENGNIDVTLSPKQLGREKITIIAIQYDSYGSIVGNIGVKTVEDISLDKTTVSFDADMDAASAKIYIWGGDFTEVNPLTDNALTVRFE